MMQEISPKLYGIIKQKCFTYYFGQIYRPIMKAKDHDIKFYEQRNDYV